MSQRGEKYARRLDGRVRHLEEAVEWIGAEVMAQGARTSMTDGDALHLAAEVSKLNRAERALSKSYRQLSAVLLLFAVLTAVLILLNVPGRVQEPTAAVEPTPIPAAPLLALQAELLEPAEKPTEAPELTLLGTFTAYAYCGCEKCCGKWAQYHLTASGTTPEEGRTVAADWDVLPAGTEIYIDGIGWRTVEDTGSGIDGQALDVYYESHQEALEFGVQSVEVYR